jgi:serine/threonine protein phosphatase PrpC
MRDNRFEQITLDHSLLQELVDRGFYVSGGGEETGRFQIAAILRFSPLSVLGGRGYLFGRFMAVPLVIACLCRSMPGAGLDL